MAINPISSVAPITSAAAVTVQASRPKQTETSPAAAVSTASSVAATTASSQAAAAPSKPSSGGAIGASPTNSTSTAEELAIAAAYSATVGGKSYTGSVSELDGEYTASVPSVPPAFGTGTTVEEAENSLTLRIDALV